MSLRDELHSLQSHVEFERMLVNKAKSVDSSFAALRQEDLARKEAELAELRARWEAVRPKAGQRYALGEFTVTSGTLVVSDPCYVLSPRQQLVGARVGTWLADVHMSTDESWGVRCGELVVHHADVRPDGDWEPSGLDVDVDSGQAGVFELNAYERDHDNERDPWYEACCELTLGDRGAGVFAGGAVSSSGYGDGCYDAFVLKEQGEVVGVRVVFVYDEDEEEDDEVEDGDDENGV